MENIGTIFPHKMDMGDNSFQFQHGREQTLRSNGNFVHDSFRRNFIHYFFTLFKMPGISLAWKLFYLLGFSITGIGFLLDTPIGQEIFASMPLGFKYSIWFFACLFLLIACLRSYEKYRKDKLANDDAEISLRIKRQHFRDLSK